MNTYVPSAWMRPTAPFFMNGGAFNGRLIQQKAPFMGIVIALMIVQLVITYYTMEILSKNTKFQEYMKSNLWLLILLLILPFVIIVILAFVPMSRFSKLILFTIFSLLFGLMLSAIRNRVTPELVRAAILATVGIFIAMFIVGLVLAGLGYDLFWLGMILFVLLIILVIAGIIMLFTDPSNKALRIRAILVIVLFSIYILFDTNQIIMRDYNSDYVMAAIDYYLDVVNIFVALLQVLGENS